MGSVGIAVRCAVAALIVGGGLSHLSPERRASLLASARAMAGGGSAPAVIAKPPAVVAAVAAAGPAHASGGFGGETIAADSRGQYHTTIEVEGADLPALVDTGATFVTLSFEDADRLGIRPLPSDFRMAMSTANGLAFAAPVRLRSVRLGGIEVRDVDAIVSGRGQLRNTLLGMSFLSRLSNFSVDHGELVLRQ